MAKDMTVHTVGDSHSKFGWPASVSVHWMGPVLCHSIGRDRLKRLDLRSFDLRNGDVVIFSFGEIDCRCQVHKYVNEARSPETVINSIVAAYVDAIEENVALLGLQIRISLFNIPPPVRKGTVWNNPEFPFVGSDEERKIYVSIFNQCLKRVCDEKGFIFFDVFDAYCDGNGFLRGDMSDGNVHIADGRFLESFLTDHDLI